MQFLLNDLELIYNAFYRAWIKAWRPKKAFHSRKKISRFLMFTDEYPHLIRLNYKRYLRKQLLKDLVGKIQAAHERVWILNPYFIPNRKIMKALQKASRGNIDVKVIVPLRSDVKIVQLAAQVYYKQLLKANVKLFQYTAGILHAKTMCIDEWCIIGSSNLNSRSLLHDLEIDTVVSEKKNIDQVVSQFKEDLNASRPLTLTDLESLPWFEKVFARIILWIKYWL